MSYERCCPAPESSTKIEPAAPALESAGLYALDLLGHLLPPSSTLVRRKLSCSRAKWSIGQRPLEGDQKYHRASIRSAGIDTVFVHSSGFLGNVWTANRMAQRGDRRVCWYIYWHGWKLISAAYPQIPL